MAIMLFPVPQAKPLDAPGEIVLSAYETSGQIHPHAGARESREKALKSA